MRVLKFLFRGVKCCGIAVMKSLGSDFFRCKGEIACKVMYLGVSEGGYIDQED